MRYPLALILAVAAIIATPAAQAAQTITIDGLPPAPAFKIAQYADVGATSGMVIVAGGSRDGIVAGAVFESYRLASLHDPAGYGNDIKTIWIKTGELKGVQIYENHAVASVTTSGTDLSRAFFPKYPGVMAGDMVVEKALAIEQGLAVTPKATMTYKQLFQDPNGSATNFELSEGGHQQLRSVAEAFASRRVSNIVVEGHTDQTGPSDRNQIESYQRALAVRQILISEFGFDESRVSAIGLGETEPAEDSFVPGFRDINRRIVIKVID